ncbi:MAG TPA: hypothetical protein VEX86_14965 [Longimicrobium sp.]|nr:hypothetical protein [Longimicrobium sp.]
MTPSPPRPDAGEPPRLQSVLRWVWLIIGLLLLVLLISAIVFVAKEAMGGRGGGASESDSARTATAERRAAADPLRYEPPVPVAGTGTRIVLIRRGSGYGYPLGYSSRSSEALGSTVNVAFLEGDGARLLLDRPAYIRRVTFPGSAGVGRDPGAGPRTGDEEALRWIVYEMALEDGDGNRRIDELDPRSLYVSGLDGRGLRRVLPAGYELLDWAPQPGGSLLATAVQLASGKKPMPERAFVLDAGGAVRPYAALDSLVDAAAVIVEKP